MREAGVDFDAPMVERVSPPPPAPPPEREPRDARRGPRHLGREHADRDQASRESGRKTFAPRETRPPAREAGGQSHRAAAPARRFPRRRRTRRCAGRGPAPSEIAPRARGAPEPSHPQRRRKHVGKLRAEIAADNEGPRKRIERSATADRKGRVVAVERILPSREETAPPRRSDAKGSGAARRGGAKGRDAARPAKVEARASAVATSPRAGAGDEARRAEFARRPAESVRQERARRRAPAAWRPPGSPPRDDKPQGERRGPPARGGKPGGKPGSKPRGKPGGRPDFKRRQAAVLARRGVREAMRVVAGRLKGRLLRAPESRAIRPTSERLRESIFDILVHRYPDALDGARVVDLFAGSGALGIEALSRGAASRCSSITALRRARCCAPMSRRSASAALPASGARTRPSSGGRRPADRLRSPLSIPL